MKSLAGLAAICLLPAMLLIGCDKLPGGGQITLVLDLAAVAKATGQEQAMQTRMQTARDDVNAQLAEAAANLEQQIEQERENIGDAPTTDQQQQLQQAVVQAQQQYGQLQTEAQQQIQQFEINMVAEFREKIRPVVEKIALSRNAELVILADQSVYWIEPAIDMTGDVISALRAEGTFTDAGPAPVTGE